MQEILLTSNVDEGVATIRLNDPAKRNALGLPMFDALDAAITSIAADPSVHVVLLHGEGPVFCAGFDLAAAVNDPALMAAFIERLSRLLRAMRRMPQIVVAAVHGAAIAGGCAMLGACDFVFVDGDAQVGYPVHRLGVSPAVTIPTLMQTIGAGAARALLMSGDLISGREAHRLGLATHLVDNASAPLNAAREHCLQLVRKGPNALRITKAWLNRLDGSLEDSRFDRPSRASAEITENSEAIELLSRWQQRSSA